MDTVQRDEIRELARLTAHLSCAQQTFFQAEYGRHRRSPTTALVLCLLLGGFGAHEFYFGRHRSGVLRLVFCWTLIPAVMALFALRDSAARARRYNAALGQRVLLALEASAAETSREARVAAQREPLQNEVSQDSGESQTDLTDVRIGTAEYDISDGNARLRRVSEQLAAALTLDRTRQATRPNTPIAAVEATRVEESSDDDVRQAATTAPFGETDVPSGAPTIESSPEPARVPVLSFSAAAVRRDGVRLGPPLAVDAALPTTWTPERITAPQHEDEVLQATQPLTRHHVQRIIVRKMALRDGQIAAEAVAERVVDLQGTEEDIELRVQQATDEARQDALRQLALNSTGDVSEAAWTSLRQHYPDAGLYA